MKKKIKKVILGIVAILWIMTLLLMGGVDVESTGLYILIELSLLALFIGCSLILIAVYGDK